MSIWIIDTNILSYWVMNEKILNLFLSKGILHEKFKEIYSKRYENSIKLIEKLLIKKKENIFVIEFSINELVSTIKDEVRTIIMFNDGTPLSKWNLDKENKKIPEELNKEIYEEILKAIDELLKNESTNFELLNTSKISDNKNYLDIYSSLIFLIPRMKTQDAVLLTTTILNKADYFVTEDSRLVESCKKVKILKQYKFEVIKSGTAIRNLNSKKIKN